MIKCLFTDLLFEYKIAELYKIMYLFFSKVNWKRTKKQQPIVYKWLSMYKYDAQPLSIELVVNTPREYLI